MQCNQIKVSIAGLLNVALISIVGNHLNFHFSVNYANIHTWQYI